MHIPFCKQKCKYCDFNSYAGLSAVHESYVDALLAEIASQAGRYGAFGTVESIYIGGGTPTLLEPSCIASILSLLKERFAITSDAEISIEANPETVTYEKLAALRESGVNRLSVGFQSLDDDLLALLGRKHSAQQAVDVLYAARRAGFDNINIDLIFGVPGQTLANWALNLEQVATLEPEHLSCYGLTIEPGTVLEHEIAKGVLKAPEEDMQADMFVYTMESLSEAGYSHYEISNYARPGKECRHNLVYWDNGDYIGFGAGAHSRMGNKRFANTAQPAEYITTVGTDLFKPEEIDLSIDDDMSETLFLGLRKMEGVNLEAFAARFGRSVQDIYGAQIEGLLGDGLIESKNGSLRLSSRGIMLGNEVFSRFV
ncbi:radical SAM family heme chaperone HemW [Candidatus Aquicultor sp.]